MITRTRRELSMRNSIVTSLVVVGLGAALVGCSPSPQLGTAYSTPDQAVDAFVTSLRSNDINGLVTVFGKGSERMFRSPDSIADRNLRADFLKLYDARHELSTK